MDKLYFADEDDNICQPLECHIEAAEKDQTEITLIEAIPDPDNPDYIWCTHYGEVVERCQCRKAECPYYESKSSRGVCSNRGNLYQYGESVTIKID